MSFCERTIAGIHHCQITVPRGFEENARLFYCNVLGLKELHKPEPLKDRGGFWLDVCGTQLHIGIEDAIERSATKAHVAYEVRNLPAWRDRLSKADVRIEEGIPIPGYRRFEFRDPFGNRVEFLERSS